MFRDELEKLKKEYIEVEKKVKDQDEIDEGMCVYNRRGHFGTVTFVLCSEVVLFSEVALYKPLELPGESESRNRVWTRNTLCLPIFGLKP